MKVCTQCAVPKDFSEYPRTTHGTLRSACRECRNRSSRESHAASRAADPERRRKRDRDRKRSSYAADPEKFRKIAREERAADPEKFRRMDREWVRANPGAKRAATARRRVKKLSATPSWAALEAIKKLYVNCPDGQQVDHIIPLQGKRVSGLHVLGNLQYLDPSENRAKGNSFSPDDWSWAKE